MAYSALHLNCSATPFSFLPASYISSVQNRKDVKRFQSWQIEKAMQTADIFEQQVILHDLLLAGMGKHSKDKRDLDCLAAKLFVKSSGDSQRDFLMHIMGEKSIAQDFSTAIKANHIYHSGLEIQKKGSSHLTERELAIEKHFALALENFR